METKEKIIQLLEEHRGEAISGQDIADTLSLTRAAVWKVIKQLEKQGYPIHATSGKGYILSDDSDILSEQGIRQYLLAPYNNSDIYIFDEVASTNTTMKELVSKDARHYTMVIANAQKEGRGRFNRSFYSPKNTGIYMTLLLKDRRSIQDATMITMIAAIAVSRVIEQYSDSKPMIKWVNDILIDAKKAVGILSEAIIDFESGMSNAIVLGIGINTTTLTQDFPEDIQNIVTSLSNVQVERNRIIAAVANEVYQLYEEQNVALIHNEYRDRSCVMHKWITFIRNKQKYEGFVEDIDEHGHLVIRIGGERHILSSGEISIQTDSIS